MNRILVFLLLLAAAASAWPEDAAPVPPQAGAAQLAAFGDIKYRVLEAEARIEASLYPSGDSAGAGARIYVGNAAATFGLQRFSLSVDGAAPAALSFEDEDAKSLAGTDELVWLKDILLAQGPHALHAEMQASDNSKPDHAIQQFALDAQVELEGGESTIEFALVAASLLSPAHMVLIQHRSDGGRQGWLVRTARSIGALIGGEPYYSPGHPNDPGMRYVKHLVRMGRGDAATVQLLRISQSPGEEDSLPARFWLQLSSALRLANLPDQAQAVCDRLDAKQAEAAAVAVERLRIGIQQYGFGDLRKAEVQLLSAQDRLPPYRVQDWQVAYAQILLDRSQYANARTVLQSGNVDSDDAYRYALDSIDAARTSDYRRFNLAVAMIQSDEVTKGLSLLDLVGRLKSGDSERSALRDKANLVLGWYFLRAKQGGTAIGILGRVRSEGSYSSPALLGMGWAQLEPAGETLARVRLSDTTDNTTNPLPASLQNSLTRLGVLEPELRGEVGPHSFTHDQAPKDREDGLRRALKFWNVLAERNAREPAVQEAMLAIAYAYDSLSDDSNARDAYTRAIAALEAQRKDIADHADFVRGGGLSGAIAATIGDADLAVVMDPLQLMPSDASRLLYASIDRYRDLVRLQNGLTDYQAQTTARAVDDTTGTPALPDIAALLAAVASAQQSEAGALQSLALAELDHQRQSVDAYLKVAYFSAARSADDRLPSAAH